MQHVDVSAKVTKPHFVLIYGQSGTGKSHLAGTLGNAGRTLVIDVDLGVETLQCAPKLAKARDKLTAVSFDKFTDLDSAYKHIKANDPDKWSKLLGIPVEAPYEWIVWDTWTELQFHMMEELRKQRSHGAYEGKLDFRKNVEIQHWGALTDLNKLSIEHLRACNVNQVFIMQEAIKEDPKTHEMFGGPAIHGQLVRDMPGYFGTVIHTSTNTMGAFQATTKSKGKWPAKARRAEGQDYTDPDLATILKLGN